MEQLSDWTELKLHQHWLLSMDNDAAYKSALLGELGNQPSEDTMLSVPAMNSDVHNLCI